MSVCIFFLYVSIDDIASYKTSMLIHLLIFPLSVILASQLLQLLHP